MSLRSIKWVDVRKDFTKVNKDLGYIIDKLDPNPSYTLYLATYPYGAYTVKNGVLQVPNKNSDTTPLTHHTVNNTIKEDLGYNSFTNPVCFVLKNTLEVFYIINNWTIPLYGLIPPGKIFSTWKAISDFPANVPAFLWDITAGARSLFMLSKLSDTAGNKRLKKAFDLLTTDKPKTALEQWNLFRLLANHQSNKNPWETQVIFFGKKWFEHLNDSAFKDFQLYLLKGAWQGSNHFRQQFIWDLIYSVIQEKRNIKAEAYIINTVRHLLTMSVGEAPGFAPAIDNFAGPIEFLKNVYRDIYQLKNYEPVFIHPHHFNLLENRPVYYSLNYPTMHNFSVRPTEEQSKIQDLISIKSVMTKFLDELKYDNLNIADTPIAQIPGKIQHKYFHSIEGFHQINSISLLLPSDPFLKQTVNNKLEKFPVNSSFLKGCVQISALDQV